MTTPATRVNNSYTTPIRPIITQVTPPSHPTVSDTLLPTTTQSSLNLPNQTIIVQPAPRDIRPLKIPNYTAKLGYSQFRTMSLLHISATADYSSLVIIHPNTNKPILNPSMTDTQSLALYLATVNALGSHASEIVSRNLTNTPDGVELWKSLDSHFLRIHTSHVLKNELKREYNTLKKDPSETYTSYVNRFECKLEQLQHNKIDVDQARLLCPCFISI